ncbi:N-acetylmuramoyl-L-alanine amidase [Quadrisphaera sp. DSM 44207]|uniref:N-acetylmuramoyl-L-alanine amidase n=1 Tax=Quadrisphaera sp. DSM 44207 TaxID=1881057 RepID=UPI00087F47C6|nr:N-acetylmuramoyl-L-alanine amidase [Quadrisphaera sp. DSM 44207]SDQ23348.1 N-acetylmuramoyl-L-alanine amidase [Quadrisphaera sp. DSM 44207]
MRGTALRRGDRGPRVAAVRTQLHAAGVSAPAAEGGEGVFDEVLERAVREFQQRRGLRADGVIGPETGRALDAARWRLGDRILRYVPGHLVVGDDVIGLQERLLELGVFVGRVDGVLGPETEHALRELQRASGIAVDGTCGPATLRVLSQLSRTVGGGDAAALRAAEAVRRAGSSLAGRVVVVDPGHGGPDPGAVAGGLVEADVVLDLAQRLEGRLAASGVTAVLTRGAEQGPDALARVRLAEEVGAELFLSLHCDTAAPLADAASPGGGGHGVATSYWGQEGTGVRSPVGARLADLLQRELVARTGMTDLRTHPRGFDVLRLTRVPAVRVDIGYLSDPLDAARLADPAFRDTCAEGMLAAVQRLYLPSEDDPPTGTLRLGDIVARSQR